MDRDELIQLSSEGKIKHKKKFLQEADDKNHRKNVFRVRRKTVRRSKRTTSRHISY